MENRNPHYDFNCSLINIAGDFYGAYQRCIEGKNPRVDEWGRHVADVVNVPVIVNGAFAMELYLKYLSPLSAKELKEKKHSLRALFLTLEEKDQANIKKQVEKGSFFPFTFEERLKVINKSFTFWRYIHEKPDLGPGLNVTLNVLHSFLEAIRKCALDKEEKDKSNSQ